MARLLERLPDRLQRYRDQTRYRQRQSHSDSGSVVFNSNDYLGLSQHPRLISAFAEAVSRYGAGSGGSHLVCGHHRQHQLLEQELADFVQRERALLFSSGYAANLGVMQALLSRHDRVVGDRLNHASLIDAARLCGVTHHRYRHLDIEHARQLLQRESERGLLLATDGVFSMDGDIAPLAGLATVAGDTEATLFVDDAHGFGVLGPHGEGSVTAAGLDSEQVPVLMATLGKSAGLQGAFVAGSEALIEALIQFSRTYIYTTALPPAVAAALRISIRLIAEESWRRERLQENIAIFQSLARQEGLSLLDSTTAIQGVSVGDAQLALRCAEQVCEQGYLVTAIRAPTVPAGSERIRITLTSLHRHEQIAGLVVALARAMPEAAHSSKRDVLEKSSEAAH